MEFPSQEVERSAKTKRFDRYLEFFKIFKFLQFFVDDQSPAIESFTVKFVNWPRSSGNSSLRQ